VRREQGWVVVGTRAGIVLGEVVVVGMGMEMEMGIAMGATEVVGIIEEEWGLVDMRAA
jgi:hypothetical protein